MRVVSGNTTTYLYFIALDSDDLATRVTGLASFTVVRSRNGAADATYTTPTISEIDAVTMPGVYALLLDEDTTLDSGFDTQEVAVHITATGMVPVTRTFELYRAKITAGETLTVTSSRANANLTHVNGAAQTATLDTIKAETAAILDDTDLIDDGTSGLAKIATDVAAVLVDTADMQPKLGTVADLGGGATLGANNTDMAGATFATATDSQEALRNRGDAAWITATGFATHSAADVWAVATRVLTAGTNIQLPSNGLANVTVWTVALTGDITGNLSGSVGSVTGAVGSVATDGITSGSLAASAISEIQSGLSTISVSDILTTAMTESYAADGVAPTLAEALFLIQQKLGDFAISGTTLTVRKLDGSTTAATYTLSDDSNPTAITRAS